MKHLTICLAAALLALTCPYPALAEHVDILAYNRNGAIDTGYVDVDSGSTLTGIRLFTETFTSVYPGLLGTTSPGFYSNNEYPLPASSNLSFDALAITHPQTQSKYNLMYWDGEGDVVFDLPISGTTLQFRLSSSTNISVDGSSDDVSGFVLDGTSPEGILHKHISYSARGSGGSNPADGLYLVAINLKMPGLTDSEPIYLLFNADYQRNEHNQIIYQGDLPLVDMNSEALAQAWIEQYLIGGNLEGDLNRDGFVGLDDLDIVLGDWNLTVPPGNQLADPSGDGYIGLDDLDAVLGNWNAGVPSSASAQIPEPGTLLAILGAGLFINPRRARRARQTIDHQNILRAGTTRSDSGNL